MLFRASFLFLVLFSVNTYSQGFKFDLDNYLRQDLKSFDKNHEFKMQARVRFKTDLSLFEHFSILSESSTGENFNSQWDDISESPYLGVRKLYAQYKKDKLSIQLGSIPTFKDYKSPLNLDKNGWIDSGARVEFGNDKVIAEVVTGRLEQFDRANLFHRYQSLKPNFIEVEFSFNLPQDVILELGLEYFDDPYSRLELRKKIKDLVHREIYFTFQGLANLGEKSFGGAFGTYLKGKNNDDFLSQFDLSFELIHLSSGLKQRALLVDEFRVFGTQLTSLLEYKPKKNKSTIFIRNISVLGSSDHSSFNNRLNIGLKYNFSN